MKTKTLFLAALACSAVAFSQKREIRDAEDQLEDGQAQQAKSTLESVQGMIANEDAKLQAEYYYIRGKVYADLGAKGDAAAFDEAVSSFNKVIEIEEASGKDKFSDDTREAMSEMTATLVNSAVEDNQNENFKDAAGKLYMGYKLSPKDTIYLYYAASSAVNGGEYEEALEYYQELKELGYDGGGMVYKATNTATGEVEEMPKLQRDLMVKSGSYTDPVDEQMPSKKPEIVKNMALIYTQLGQDDKAIQAYKDARENNPNDVNLILNEANLYYKLGDQEKFKSLMEEASEMAPDNPDLQYNIGVINMEQGNIEAAREAYERALEIDPNYINAQLNLSTSYVNEGNSLIDDMNELGNSKADIERYEELKQEKDELFLKGAKILEEALEKNPDNQSIMTQLKNIYGALGDTENFMRMKKMLGE